MYRKIAFIFIILLLTFASAFSAISSKDYNSVKRDLAYIEKSRSATRTSYTLVAEKFYKLYRQSPSSSLADDSLYLCGMTYIKSYNRFKNKEDLKNALKYFRLAAVNYKSKWAAESYLQAAEIYVLLDDYASARYMLNKLIGKFKTRPEAKEAKKKLQEIEKKFQRDVEIKSYTVSKSNGNNSSITKANSSNGNDSKQVVKNIRYFSSDDYTRVVIDVNDIPKFEKHWLKANPEYNKPPRLFIDLFNTDIDRSIDKVIEIKDGLLKSVRWGLFDKGTTRIVLDSENVKDFTVFTMSNPDRIVIDVSGSPDGVASKTDVSTSANNEQTGVSTLAGIFGLKVKTIVIDPGHGGHDPGASYYGINEKDVVLDVGLYLKELLRNNFKDLNIYMTREEDVFIPLEERTAFANKKRADLFISIHVNASRNKSAYGVETYVLNVTNDKGALEVAAFENQATEKSLSDLQGILKDIMLNSKLEESLMLAKFVQDELSSGLRDKNLGVKQAPFYVLVGAKMPSVLVECGFLSNKKYLSKFNSKSYRKAIAENIYKGIKEYIEKYNGKN
ncbi:N-acetylmuramoyl-L-alanine amidase [Deferribacterales bacterium Es71-Z0220]|uniref:N-acetylmuramoyl-L-alanine amidase n=1 Tax=Deferrivibrio essentukiensis TaxID=2880922 RepID=UPI001F62590B|nr:N-acetylmuramoyl-L-alanine amidase [Deferrivibrio essentukiensis]MCB4203899.1 N-acetylmuramoyl-L-alanine amidase [Deferrivibrio essentukiensis]